MTEVVLAYSAASFQCRGIAVPGLERAIPRRSRRTPGGRRQRRLSPFWSDPRWRPELEGVGRSAATRACSLLGRQALVDLGWRRNAAGARVRGIRLAPQFRLGSRSDSMRRTFSGSMAGCVLLRRRRSASCSSICSWMRASASTRPSPLPWTILASFSKGAARAATLPGSLKPEGRRRRTRWATERHSRALAGVRVIS